MATMTMAMQTIIIPKRLNPDCFLTIPPADPWTPASFEASEAAGLAEVEPDEERLADNVLVRNEPPHPAVRGVVAVVSHHEVMPRRHCTRHARVIVGAIITK